VGDTINLESPAGTGGVSAVIWESSNPCVASVNSAGIVAAHREGTATLTAAADTERGFCTLNVVERGFVTVISCISNDWQDSSGTMGNSMSSAMGTDNSAVVVTPVNSTAFADCWNNAGHCLVIHTHGTPSELSGEEKINNVKIQNKIISVEEIRALEQNEHIDFIMMTSCSTAGGNPDENVACELSKKINPCGIVIANKRNVSGADKDFYASGEVPGWVAYRNGTVITEDLPVELNMEDAYEIFKNLT